MTKAEQRALIKEKLKNISEEKKLLHDKKIREEVLNLLKSLKVKSVFSFLSQNKEPDTIFIIAELLRRGVKIALPKCVNETMFAIEYDENCALKVGQFGIIEPDSQKQIGAVDAVLVPLVAFDKNLNRLGKGKGFYDRYLKNINAIKIGVAYSIQEVDCVVTNEFDIKLDYIVTENIIYN